MNIENICHRQFGEDTYAGAAEMYDSADDLSQNKST